MGIEKVKEEVVANAKRESAAAISEAQKEARTIIAQAEQKGDAKKKKAIEEAEREVEETRTRELSSAELEAIKMLLDAKKRIIDEAFEEAKQRISKSPQAQRKSHTKALIDKARKEIEICKILCSESDIKNIQGYKCQTAGITGGIIVENEDGTIRIDCSYEAIMEKVRDKTLKDVAKILFKE